MCVGPLKPKTPTPPQQVLPPPVEVPPPADLSETETASKQADARKRQRSLLALAAGRSSTIRNKAGAQGLGEKAQADQLKTVLGA